MSRSAQSKTKTRRNGEVDDKTAAARRILNLLFILNSASAPIPTSQIISDSDLGYGSSTVDSDKRKFQRDRDLLAEQGIIIKDVRPQGGSQTEEASWVIDREHTFIAGGLLDMETLEILLRVVDLELESPDSPFLVPARRIRTKLLELTEIQPTDAPHNQPTPAEEAVWTAFSLKKQLKFTYVNVRGEKKKRSCCIYGFFSEAGKGYFVGLDDSSDKVKTFRIDNVLSVRKPGDSYEIPQDFSIHDYFFLPFDFAEGPKTTAVFAFPSQRTELELSTFTHGRGEVARDTEHDRWLWTIETPDLSGAARFVLGHADLEPRPVEPPELIDAWNNEIDKAVCAHAC